MAENRAIGINNQLPWHLSSDLQYFKRMTLAKPIIMGRKTFDSIGRPLPGRPNIVVTRDPAWQQDGVVVANSVDAAITLARDLLETLEQTEVMVIGGAQLYRECLPQLTCLYVTEVKCRPKADAFFPPLDKGEWREISREHVSQTAKDDFDFDLVVYERS